MKNLTLLFAALSLTLAVGCKKKDGDSSAAAAKTTETAPAAGAPAAPAAPGVTCPAGFTGNAIGHFCIKLPSGVTGDGGKPMDVGENHGQQFSWAGGDKGSDFGITVVVAKMDQYFADNLERQKAPPYQGKAVADGKIGDGTNGAWATAESSEGRHVINSMIKNDKMQLSCNITRANGPGKPAEDEIFDACKTITFAP